MLQTLQELPQTMRLCRRHFHKQRRLLNWYPFGNCNVSLGSRVSVSLMNSLQLFPRSFSQELKMRDSLQHFTSATTLPSASNNRRANQIREDLRPSQALQVKYMHQIQSTSLKHRSKRTKGNNDDTRIKEHYKHISMHVFRSKNGSPQERLLTS